MNYVAVVNLVFLIINGLIGVYLFHYIFFAFVGIVHKKRFPKSEEKCRYGVVISAKDEENVIPRLIKGIRDADYPQDKLDIYIIAHNCEDNTAEVARSLGATVIVRNCPSQRTLGYAYNYAFKYIDTSKYDGIVILNADNIVKKDYFEKLNDAFVYYEKESVVVPFRHSLNIKDGVMPALYYYYFAIICSLGYKGRESFNVSSRITGCGFVLPVKYLENGWNYVGITEDVEFSADKILNGKVIHYCDDAIFYDEQPLDFKTMWFQRLRWAKGQNMTSKRYFGKFLKAMFQKDKKNKMSLYTALTFNSFIPLTGFFLLVLQSVLLLFSPLFGVSLQEAFLYWNHDQSWIHNLFFSLNLGGLYGLSKSLIGAILMGYLTIIATILASRDKLKGQAKLPLFLAFLLFPPFILLQIPLDLTVMFAKEIKWRKIPHGVTK